jgi:DNA-binding PucR family transcriptional regulator
VDFCLVIGGPARGLDGWRQTHREARDALVVALRKPERIVRYADSPLFAAAVQNDTLMRWLKDFLAPLRSQKDGGIGLLQTLRALIDAECNRRAAASALDVDRHTVESRLRTAEQLLGRTLPTCLPELDIALRLEEFDGAITAAGPSRRP